VTDIKSLLESSLDDSSNRDNARLDSQLLLSHVLGKSREWLLAHSEAPVEESEKQHYQALLYRWRNGEPVAYLLGYKDFWESRFEVTRDTLIPRPETELLIEILLESYGPEPRFVVDAGSGSGAIAVSLAGERPDWLILANDLSLPACRVAQKNAGSLPNLYVVQADWLSYVRPDSVDIVVTNPPYIREADPHLTNLSFEPERALVAADDGLSDITKLLTQARQCLKEEGTFLTEHGYDQQHRVVELFTASGFSAETYQDLGGQPRAVLGRLQSRDG